jgi:hypothetical protein
MFWIPCCSRMAARLVLATSSAKALSRKTQVVSPAGAMALCHSTMPWASGSTSSWMIFSARQASKTPPPMAWTSLSAILRFSIGTHRSRPRFSSSSMRMSASVRSGRIGAEPQWPGHWPDFHFRQSGNGAGYSSYFGTPIESESLLRFVAGQTSAVFYGPLVAQAQGHPAHARICRTSCLDCLRDFSNLAYHNILDWRLGLDLARLALDPNAAIDFSVSYWHGLDAAVAGPYFAAMPGWQQVNLRRSSGGPTGKSCRDYYSSALQL